MSSKRKFKFQSINSRHDNRLNINYKSRIRNKFYITHRPRNCVPGPGYICHNCGIPGHYRKDCRNPRHKGPCPPFFKCKKCKGQGRWIEDCPERLRRIQQSIKGQKKKSKSKSLSHKSSSLKAIDEDEDDDMNYSQNINNRMSNHNNRKPRKCNNKLSVYLLSFVSQIFVLDLYH